MHIYRNNHDTGVFKYSCTSRRTMDIAGKMMEMELIILDIIDNSFYKKSYDPEPDFEELA